MAQERKESEMVMPLGGIPKVDELISQIKNGPPPNYRGMERLLWYIYDKRVARIEAAKLIHVYTVAWADAREKILERDAKVAGAEPDQNGLTEAARTDAVPA